MAGRIRTIKPEWLEDEKLLLASPSARVLSVALILEADDYGNGRGNRELLVSRIFPAHSREGQEAFDELLELRYFDAYQVRGQTYFTIRNWTKHQRVDKPGKPRVPAPCEADQCRSEKARESPANLPETPGPDHDHDHDHDRERDHDARANPDCDILAHCKQDAVRLMAERIWQDQEDLRQELKLEGVGVHSRSLGMLDPAKLELSARISEALGAGKSVEEAAGDCRHVLDVLAEEARCSGSLRWLDGGHWTPKRYASALTREVGEPFRAGDVVAGIEDILGT